MKLALLIATIAVSAAAAADMSGTVTRVTDGDSVVVTIDGGRYTLRLADVDAPELRQAGGVEARAALAGLCLQRPAVAQTLGTDRYGRVRARLVCGGTDANTEQVRAGWAWVYPRAPRSSPLRAVQDEARSAGRGVWSGAPRPPWEWRAEQRR